jgi:CRP-like cAMP-binding protein
MGRKSRIEDRKREVCDLLRVEQKSLTKRQIADRLEMPYTTVTRVCCELRKAKVIGMHRRKWWGLV